METIEKTAVEDYSMLQIQAQACLKESFNASLKKDWSRAELLARMASEFASRLSNAYSVEKSNG